MPYIQITIDNTPPETTEILVALLSSTGFEGFEELENQLMAFVPEEDWREEDLQKILDPFNLRFQAQKLPEKNWNEEWEKNFEPVRVGDFCAVRASFHEPLPGVEFEIVITPKMSFGTGHHATTYMMMEAMQQIAFRGRTVLDFGTGTGVLAILAEKLGAEKVLGIDNDEWSINNATENVIENQSVKVSITRMDSIGPTGRFDVLLANINKNVLLQSLPSMTQHLEKGGVIIMSGLLSEDETDMINAASASDYKVVRKLSKANWICLQLERN